MDKEAVQMMSFELVAHAGEATAHFTDAIKYAREGDFCGARSPARTSTSACCSCMRRTT